jgi:hypothetical protein
MHILTKTAGIALAAAALCGITSLGSTAFADTTTDASRSTGGTQLGSSQGFHIYNMTGEPLTLSRIDGDRQFEGAPTIGSVLEPGQVATFEVKHVSAWWDYDNVVYRNPQGKQVVIGIGIEAGTIPESQCLQNGPYECSRPYLHQKEITITDHAGTVHELSGGQALAEAQIVKELCANGGVATCHFTPESEEKAAGPRREIAWHENDGRKTDHWKVATTDTVEASNSVDVSMKAGTKFSIFGQEVDMEIKASYGHESSTGHEFAVSDTVEVDPGYVSHYYAVAPVLRDTGTITVTVYNCTWKLHGMVFDTPDPSGVEGTSHTEIPVPPAPLHLPNAG